MKRINFKNACKRLTSHQSKFTFDGKTMDLDALFSVFSNEFMITRLRRIQNSPDADMLLFEYGHYDWTGEGLKFDLSLKRQLLWKGQDEPGSYGVKVEFDADRIGPIEPFSKWCENPDKLTDWLDEIQATDGFQRAQATEYEKFEFEFLKEY